MTRQKYGPLKGATHTTILGNFVRIWEGVLFTAGLAALAVLFVTTISYLLKSKLNLPLSDEWGMFNPSRGLDHELHWRWLFATTNSHPMVFERLFHWYTLITTGYDFRAQSIAQTVIVLIAAVIMIVSMKKLRVALPLIMAGLFTASQAPNHFWPHEFFFFVHFLLILTTAYLLAKDEILANALGYLAALISIVQSGGGLGSTVALIAVGVCLSRRTGFRRIHIIGVTGLVAGLGAWLLFGIRDNAFEIVAYPWHGLFWGTFDELFVNGLGLGLDESYPARTGTLLFVLLMAELVAVCFSTSWLKKSGFLERFGIILVCTSLGIAASIAASRATHAGLALDPRYHIVGYHLLAGFLMLTLSLLQRLASDATVTRVFQTAAITLFALTFIPKLNVSGMFETLETQQSAVLTCARLFFANQAKSCPAGPFGDAIQVRVTQRSRELGATWCFTVMDMSQLNGRTEECYARLYETWRPMP